MDSGKTKASFSIATSESYKGKDGNKVTDTQWHNVVAWGKTAEIVEKLLVKGSQIAVEGKLTNRSYDDKDGNKRYVTEIIASEFILLNSPKDDAKADTEETK